MTDEERARAIDLVRRLSTGEFPSEELAERAMEELELFVTDPYVSDLVFWPNRHPRSAGIPEDELTPEQIVELACRYEPFAL